MHSRPLVLVHGSRSRPLTTPSAPVWREVALVRAARAAGRACERLPEDAPERARWCAHSRALLDGLARTMAGADEAMREAIAVQLDDIVETSRDDLELVRRLVVLASHAHDHLHLCDDPRVPAAVRRRASALQFRLFDRVAKVRRDPAIEQLARRRNEVFVELGLRPRSLTLVDWCDVAVRIALGSPLRDMLETLPPTEADRLLSAKVRFDLLAIELNIALDDLADDGRDAGLFALTVDRVLGPALGPDVGFPTTTPVGRYFLEQRADAEARLRGERAAAYTRYLALVDELYRELVAAGRALTGDRWDDARWSAQMRRIIGAMLLSLIQNQRPDLLAQVDWFLDFHGSDRLSVQAANSNRVVFELVGLWCYERYSGRELGGADEARLLCAFEDLQIAQQLSNCLATLERELDEGDRSNCVVARADELWRARSEVQRTTLAHEAGLARLLCTLSLSPASEDLIEALYEVLQRQGLRRERELALRCLRGLLEATGAVPDLLEQWSDRVHAAAEAIAATGFCGSSSRQAQIDLLLLHLVLLRKSPLARSGERH